MRNAIKVLKLMLWTAVDVQIVVVAGGGAVVRYPARCAALGGWAE